jgi:hypothetical protein
VGAVVGALEASIGLRGGKPVTRITGLVQPLLVAHPHVAVRKYAEADPMVLTVDFRGLFGRF